MCRDLISSADNITSVSSKCKDVCTKISSLAHQLKIAAEEEEEVPEGGDIVSEEDGHTAILVKQLVDSQEAIYGYLERREYLAATQRYLQAVDAYKLLKSTPTRYRKKFPFLDHLWPAVQKLETEIWNSNCAWLRDIAELDSNDITRSLLGLVLLRTVDGNDLLKKFLNLRREHIVAYLAAQDAGQGSKANIASLAVDLRYIAGIVSRSIEYLMVFFHEASLGASLCDEVVSTTILTDKMSGPPINFTKEKSLLATPFIVSKTTLSLELKHWLTELNSKIMALLRPSFEVFDTCEELHALEMDTKMALDGWKFSSSVKQTETMSWSEFSQISFGESIGLWHSLFDDLVAIQAKNIINHNLEIMTASVLRQIERTSQDSISIPALRRVQNFGCVADNSRFKIEEIPLWIDAAEQGLNGVLVWLIAAVRSYNLMCTPREECLQNAGSTKMFQFKDDMEQLCIASVQNVLEEVRGKLFGAQNKESEMSVFLFTLHFIELLIDFQEYKPANHNLDSLRNFAQSTMNQVDVAEINSVQGFVASSFEMLCNMRREIKGLWSSRFSDLIKTHLEYLESIYDINSETFTSSCEVWVHQGHNDGIPGGAAVMPILPSCGILDYTIYYFSQMEKLGTLLYDPEYLEELLCICFGKLPHFVLGTMNNFLKSGYQPNYLQMIYDILFVSSFHSTRQEAREQVLSALCSNLDPIDWASIQSTIMENVASFLGSSSLYVLQKPVVLEASRFDGQRSVCLQLAPALPRFPYLPTKIPSRNQTLPKHCLQMTTSYLDGLTALSIN